MIDLVKNPTRSKLTYPMPRAINEGDGDDDEGVDMSAYSKTNSIYQLNKVMS
jgi:hypothetical protein